MSWRMKLRPRLIPTLLVLDALLSIIVVLTVRYTEIDWVAYMEEVAGFLQGELDYRRLQGSTGPLVYPAGFLYIFSGLYYATDSGHDIRLAQWVWVGLYVLTTAMVMKVYYRCRTPTLLIVPLVLSKRIHSIFMLRMFNDCVAMIFMYLAVAALVLGMRPRWKLASTLYSLGVGVKMNLFLFAPAFAFLWWRCLGLRGAAKQLAVCALVQLVIGAPFLLSYPQSYLAKAFELNRVFTYEWTVNFRFIPEDLFVAPLLGRVLLFLTVLCWLLVWHRRWRTRNVESLDSALIVATLFESNMIGIAFSRTLHYQFYVWFFHQIPFVLYFSCRSLPHTVRLVILVVIEVAFNTFPSTSLSSGLLVAALWIIVGAMLVSRDKSPPKSQQQLK